MGLETKRQTFQQIIITEASFDFHFTFLMEEEPLCVCQNPNYVPFFPYPCPSSPTQFIKDLVKGARLCHSFLFLCQSCAASTTDLLEF